MKKVILRKQILKIFFGFALCSTFLNSKAQTSVYHPFPDSGIVWREETYSVGSASCCCSGDMCIVEHQYEIFIDGDTIIGGKVYHKLYETGSRDAYIWGLYTCPPSCNGNSDLSYFYHEFRFGMREDTSLRQVFLIHPSDTAESLLYDFNLNIGDTLPITANNRIRRNFVSGIDSILIGKYYHKRYLISQYGSPNFVSIIEGIGSTYGLYWYLEPPFEFSTNLKCVIINSHTVYPDTNTVCDIVDAVSNFSESKSLLSFYPNPASNKIIIKDCHLCTTLEIHNILGKKVFQSKITDPKSEIQIDISGLNAGIYLVTLSDGEKIYRGKLVKN